MPKLSNLKQDVSNALVSGNERPMLAFLKDHANLIYFKFESVGGHAEYVLREFPLGSNYVADFVVAVKYSGAWNIHFIEMEPPKDKVITRAGLPSARLAAGLKQLRDWRQYIDDNKPQIREDLARWFSSKDILHKSKHKPPSLKNRADHIWFKYHVVIGRRELVDANNRRAAINLIVKDGMCTISTYDSFLDLANVLDNGGSLTSMTNSDYRRCE